jgi:hypothetical protein
MRFENTEASRVRSIMRIFWIGIGLLVVSTAVVVPYIASGRCKDRWAPLNLEGVWDYQTGCRVRVGGSLVREEYISFDPRAATSLDPTRRDQTLGHSDWVVLGPDHRPAIEGTFHVQK